jgi:hypothetical protein
LQVISVDVPQYDSQFAAAKKANFELLNKILGGVTHNIRHVGDPLDLLGAFKSKEYSATAYYSGPFRIADTMTIKVKVVPPACLSAVVSHEYGCCSPKQCLIVRWYAIC